VSTEVSYRFPYEWLDEPGFGGDIDQENFPEPSGLVYHTTRDSIFVVSDEGFVSEIGKDGTPISNFIVPGDLEGVTFDPSSGLIYVLVEGIDVILEIDPDNQQTLRTFTIDRSYGGDSNFIQKQTEKFDNGCESITFVPDEKHPEGGTFFVSNQWDPSCIFELQTPIRSGKEKDLTATISRVLPVELNDPAAMYFDSRTGLLNIVNDADNILYEVSLEGQIVRQYAFLGDNQEGLTIDLEGYLYIAQDTGGILKVKDLR